MTKLVALVTGANKGIGLQIAKDLAARGFTVFIGRATSRMGRSPRGVWDRAPARSSSTSRITPRSPPPQSASGASSAVSTCSSTTPASRTRGSRACRLRRS